MICALPEICLVNPDMATDKKPNLRNRELAMIHIAKQQLGLDDETYRSMLWTVGRVASSKDLDHTGRRRVLEHLTARGWNNKPARKAQSSRPLAADPQSKMIRGLWLELHNLGEVKNPAESALNSFIKRHTGIDRLEWLSGKQASEIIEILKKWRDRL